MRLPKPFSVTVRMRQGVRPSFSSSLASLAAAASEMAGAAGVSSPAGEFEGLGGGGVGGFVDGVLDVGGQAGGGGAVQALLCCGLRWRE